jgi:hypothetical protein
MVAKAGCLRGEIMLHRCELAAHSIEQRAEMVTLLAQAFNLKRDVHEDSSLVLLPNRFWGNVVFYFV